MATLQDIINNNQTLTRSQLTGDRALVIEIQTKLANLGFYPGGGWIDGGLGDLNSFSWKGLIDFCTKGKPCLLQGWGFFFNTHKVNNGQSYKNKK